MRDIHPIKKGSEQLFKPYGFEDGDVFVRLKAQDLEQLMMGHTTGVIPSINGKLGFVRDADGGLDVKFYLCHDDVEKGELNLSAGEIKRLKERGVIYTETNIEGGRNRSFVQLDRETNCLMVAKSDDISMYFPLDILKTDITKEQREQLREGRSIVVEVGNTKYTMRIDLERYGGFRIEQPVTDEYGVKYSADGKLLMETSGAKASHYKVKEGTEAICRGALRDSLITHLELPDSVEYIGIDAFGYSRLEEVNFGMGVKTIVGVNPFAHCHTMKRVTCESPLFVVEQGLLYSSDYNVLYGAVTDEFPKELELHKGLKEIVNGAFNDRKRLKKVIIPDSVVQMGRGCFFRSGLEEVKLSGKTKVIQTESFAGCRLRKLELPEGVEVLEDGAFSDNEMLTEVSLPRSLKKQGRDVFAGCPIKG